MKRYEVKFKQGSSNALHITTVTASSASQAREQIKSRYNGNVSIISVVEK